MRLNSLSRFMVLVILLVSPRAIPCPIDHSSIMDSYLSLVYISLPQFPMITSVLPNDPIITSPNRDRSGLISYLPTNSRSSKTNCGIKAVIHNKVGDLRFPMTSAFPYPFLPFINYPPFLPFSIPILFIMFFPSFLRAVDVWHVGPSFWSP